MLQHYQPWVMPCQFWRDMSRSKEKTSLHGRGINIGAIPSSHDALLQHTKRSVYQAGYCWSNSLVPSIRLPCPSEWGWVKGSKELWEPLWLTIPQALQSCQQLLKCGCKSERGCTGRCKCVRAKLPCTALCNCGGICNRD